MEGKSKLALTVLGSDKGLAPGAMLACEVYFQNSFMNKIYNDNEIRIMIMKSGKLFFFFMEGVIALYCPFIFGEPNNC